MAETGFVVGGRYANAAGEYEIVTLDGPSARIRYANGFEMSLPAQGLWAQWEALVAERTGRPAAPPRPATPRSPAVPRTAGATSSRPPATRSPREPAVPKGKKPRGEDAFFLGAGYLSTGCEIRASVAGRDYPAFAQRYKIHTGRSLVTPHEGLEVHERPTHRMGADLVVIFPADSNIVSYLDFGPQAKVELADETGMYRVGRPDVIERLFKLGFDLGQNKEPSLIRERVPQDQQINFDRGVSLRRTLRW